MDTKKILTLSIERNIFRNFKVCMAGKDIENVSKLIEILMKEWTEKNKEKSVKSN